MHRAMDRVRRLTALDMTNIHYRSGEEGYTDFLETFHEAVNGEDAEDAAQYNEYSDAYNVHAERTEKERRAQSQPRFWIRHLQSQANYLEIISKSEPLKNALNSRIKSRIKDPHLQLLVAWPQATFLFENQTNQTNRYPATTLPRTYRVSQLVRTWETAYLFALFDPQVTDGSINLIVDGTINETGASTPDNTPCEFATGVEHFREWLNNGWNSSLENAGVTGGEMRKKAMTIKTNMDDVSRRSGMKHIVVHNAATGTRKSLSLDTDSTTWEASIPDPPLRLGRYNISFSHGDFMRKRFKTITTQKPPPIGNGAVMREEGENGNLSIVDYGLLKKKDVDSTKKNISPESRAAYDAFMQKESGVFYCSRTTDYLSTNVSSCASSALSSTSQRPH